MSFSFHVNSFLMSVIKEADVMMTLELETSLYILVKIFPLHTTNMLCS